MMPFPAWNRTYLFKSNFIASLWSKCPQGLLSDLLKGQTLLCFLRLSPLGCLGSWGLG